MAFRNALGCVWRAALRRRSQTTRVTWRRVARLTARWFPTPRICHPYPKSAWRRSPKVGAGCGNAARPDLWSG